MPDDRLFHKRLGQSVKVNALTDLEYIVWHQYILTADDFGVLPLDPLALQATSRRLRSRPARSLQRALERIAEIGLVRRFAHQDSPYVFQHDWQDFQKVEYPRTTIHPRPDDASLADCTTATRHLFSVHPGGVRVPSRRGRQGPEGDDDSGNIPGKFPEDSGTSRARSRAPGRASTASANGSRLTQGGAGGDAAVVMDDASPDVSAELDARVRRFLGRYASLYTEHRHGARYHGKTEQDYHEAIGLVSTWDDDRLEQLVVAFLTTDEPWCRNGAGSLPQFRARASWCDAKLREAGL